jgi:predicted nucleic-acid-binding protein
VSRLWVDANVILRFITKEPLEMAERAARLMARAEAGEVSLYLSPLVLAEIIWVLKSFYNFGRADIANTMTTLVSASGIVVDDQELIIRALGLFRDQNVDYVDAYLAVQAAHRGEKVCTFDTNDFKRLPAGWLMPE